MSVGIENEWGFRNMTFLKKSDRYIIDTEELPQIRPGFTLLTNSTFGKIEWNPRFMELVPIIALFGKIDFPQDHHWISDKMKNYKVANIAVGNYISYYSSFFEKGKEIPASWKDVPTILCLGTIAQKTSDQVGSPLLVNSLNRQVSLSNVNILKDARVLMYKM